MTRQLLATNRRTNIAVAVALLLLSACGAATSGTAGDQNPKPRVPPSAAPVVTKGDEPLVACGGGNGWPPSVMADGVPGVLTDTEAERIFQSILDDSRTGAEAELSLFPDGVDVEWRVLRDDEDTLTLGLRRWTEDGPSGQGAYQLTVEHRKGAWVATGWRDCHLEPVLEPGHSWAEVTGYRLVDAEPASLAVDVSETDCTGGRDPDPFLRTPLVVETAEAVTMYWTTTPATGAQACPGNPAVERVVQLSEPLGSRELLDGGKFPARPVKPAR